MLKTVILMPTYNERENIGTIVPEIFSAHPDMYILVIDDNSPDKTAEKVKEMQATYPHLMLHSRAEKKGLGEAYKDAMKRVVAEGGWERVITMDADGSHAVEHLSAMLEGSMTNDLVIGSRYTKGGGIENWTPERYLLSQFGNFYARTLTGLPLRDMTAGFLCFHGDLLKRINLDAIGASGYAFLIDLKYQAIGVSGAKPREVPIMLRVRREGVSKISGRIIREGLRVPLRIFFRRIGFTN